MAVNAVTTVAFRASYPNLFKPRKNDLNGKEEFSVVALFPKDADLKNIEGLIMEAATKKWGTDKTKWPSNLKTPLRDQKEKEKDGKLPDGHVAGAKFATLKSTARPTVVDQSRQEILEEHKIYSGCWLRASIGAYAYDQKGNRGVALALNHVQLVKDDQPLSGRPRVEDAFQAIETGATDAGQLFS